MSSYGKMEPEQRLVKDKDLKIDYRWYGGTFEDGILRNYRFEGLTNDPVFGILKVEAMKARDARLALAQEIHD